MSITRPAAIAIAAGLLILAAGTAGLLLTRQQAAAMRPPPRGVATVPAPAGPIASPPLPAPPERSSTSPRSTSRRSHGAGSRTAGSGTTGSQATVPAATARPVALTIPLIGVRTSLITLGRAPDGTMQVPSSTAVAGWYTGSVRPGAVGPAVLVGHVDSVSGPGVFFRLSQLRRGDHVYVTRSDGTIAEFTVTAVRSYSKTVLPAKAIFGATPDPELRLITCGGVFDAATGHYLSNIVVYATDAA